MTKVINRVIVKAQAVDLDEMIDEITDNINGIEDVVCVHTEDFKYELDISVGPEEFKYHELEDYIDENIGSIEFIDSWEY